MFYLVSVKFNPLSFLGSEPARPTQKKDERGRLVKGLITPHSFRKRDVILTGDTPSSWYFRLVFSLEPFSVTLVDSRKLEQFSRDLWLCVVSSVYEIARTMISDRNVV